jgi:hypothetical protein
MRFKIYTKTPAYKIKTQSGPYIQIKNNQDPVNKNTKQSGPLETQSGPWQRISGEGAPALAVGRSGAGPRVFWMEEQVTGGCVEQLGGSRRRMRRRGVVQPWGAPRMRRRMHRRMRHPFRHWVAVHARAQGMGRRTKQRRAELAGSQPAGTMSRGGGALRANGPGSSQIP